MTTRRLLSAFIRPAAILSVAALTIALLATLSPVTLRAQGMPIDSVLPRIGAELHNPTLATQLRAIIPNYELQRVWGLAIGDFSNDSLPDVAISLYNTTGDHNTVRVYLLENQNNQQLVLRYQKPVTYVESPIEVGLTADGSVVTIIQKTGDQHWFQEGYSIESGDVVLVDRFETEKEDVTGDAKTKARSIGHEVYRNYENLRTRESYFTGSSGDAMFTSNYYTLPAYQRLRDVYPGYGYLLSDTTRDFFIQGAGIRRGASDISIQRMQAAYDDDNLYISARILDNAIVGGQPRVEANDRISFWFDTKYTGDRLNRDRRLLSKKGGFPTFRDMLDSLVYNITFALPAQPGRLTQVTYSSLDPLTPLQQEGLRAVRAQMLRDTVNGMTDGYIVRVRIPFSFLGFDLNPAKLYETRVPPVPNTTTDESTTNNLQNGMGEAATLGFTALVYDVDDPGRVNETKVEATSTYREGNPATFGTLILEPSTLYYGEVHPTYLDMVRSGLAAAGY